MQISVVCNISNYWYNKLTSGIDSNNVLGIYKIITIMEHVAGRVGENQTTKFKEMGGVVNWSQVNMYTEATF